MIEDVYSLSPLQEGIYFRWLQSPELPIYIEQVSTRLEGELDVNVLRKSYSALIAKYAILRTYFSNDIADRPLQIVQSEVEPVFHYFSPASGLNTYLESDKHENFDLHTPSQMRLAVFKMDERSYHFVWTHHHILMDGWCLGILIKDFFQIYYAIKDGTSPVDQKPPLYSSYINWLSLLDSESSIRYWRDRLSGFASMTRLPQKQETEGNYQIEEQTFLFDEALRKAIASFCATRSVTENTFIQLVWATLLGRYNNDNDVVFGSIVSGRPADVKGINQMVGLFINVVPVRIQTENGKSIDEALIEIQQSAIESLPQQYSFLSDIQAVTECKPLFDHVIAFENFPVPELGELSERNLLVASYDIQEQNGYDLSVFIISRNDLRIKFAYNHALYSPFFIETIWHQFSNICRQIVTTTGIKFGDIELGSNVLLAKPSLFHKASLAIDQEFCSEHQKRLWFVDRFENGNVYPHSPVYHNVSILAKVKILPSEDEFVTRIAALITDNPILKTCFPSHDGKPMTQLIHKKAPGLNRVNINRAIKNALFEELSLFIHQPFDIETDYLIRFYLISSEDEDDIFLIVAHGLIVDKCSINLLMDQVLLGKNVISPSDTFQRFEEFNKWRSSTIETAESVFWKRNLKYAPTLYFETDFERDPVHVYQPGFESYSFDQKLSLAISEFCFRNRIAPREFLLTAFNILLHRYTGMDDLVIGTVNSLRDSSTRSIIGPIGNLVALRNTVKATDHFIDLSRSVAFNLRCSMEFGLVSFEKIAREVTSEKDMSRTALFDTLFQFEDLLNADHKIELNQGMGKYDINFLVTQNDLIRLALTYNGRYFTRARMKRLLVHFENLCRSVLTNPDAQVGHLEMVSEKEFADLVHVREAGYPLDKTIVDLFEHQVTLTPTRTAVDFQNVTLQYAELNEQVNRFSDYLTLTYQVAREDLVGIQLERSEWVVVVMLAVLKAGAAYVPVDPRYPTERIQYTISDSKCKVVITSFDISEFQKSATEFSNTNPLVKRSPADLAYVIYTSGSTGVPKGSLIEHRNVVRLFKTDQPLFDFSHNDVWTLFHSVCFDFSVWEIYGALLFGGKLVIVPEEATQDMSLYLDLIHHKNVTVVNQTPSVFYNLIAEDKGRNATIKSLRYVIFGGEELRPAELADWKQRYPAIRLINMYGITETTVHVTFKEIQMVDIEMNSRSIGLPITTTQCYILDQHQQVVPIGIPGELYVGGAGVGRGYLFRKELTAERFIENPFRLGERLYRSGDRAKWTENKDMIYKGRFDDQVKIRGYRIELGEIENAIRESGLVKQALAIAHKYEQNEATLVGYVIPNEGFSTTGLISKLRERLPTFMIPTQWVEMTEFRINQNGKIDKRSLPKPNSNVVHHTESVAPSTETEIKLVEIWRSLLRVNQINIKSNFFEIGGHSLSAMRLIASIRQKFGIELAVKTLFVNPTLENLSTHLDEQLVNGSSSETIPSLEQTRAPLSYSQERIWFIDQFEGSTSYHVPFVVVLEGIVNADAIAYAFSEIIRRHTVLRMIIKNHEDGIPYQEKRNADEWQLQQSDWCESISSLLEKTLREWISTPFDLSRDFKIRAWLFKLEKEKFLLAVNLHHIASDGWSLEILWKEFVEFYSSHVKNRKARVYPLPIQYADYAAWQRSPAIKEKIENHLKYWKLLLAGTQPLNLYKESFGSKGPSAASLKFHIDKEIADNISGFARREGGTSFMGLFTAFTALLFRYTGQDDFCIGTPVANRQHQQVHGLIGFFINTLPLRNKFTGDINFIELFRKVKETAIGAFDHQDVPFERIVAETVKERDVNRTPLFQVMFALNNNESYSTQSFDDIKVSWHDSPYSTSKLDLTLHLEDTPHGLVGKVDYNANSFSVRTIEKLVTHFRNLLNVISTNPQCTINEASMMLPSETEEIEQLGHSFSEHPADQTVIDLFDETASQHPDEYALVFEKTCLTYRELKERANQVASVLLSNGLKKQELVAVSVKRSAEAIIGILGILKAGGAYVPIDPAYPEERILFILNDTEVRFWLANKEDGKKISILKKGLIYFDLASVQQQKTYNINHSHPQELIYALYTSGSTGMPKGVLLNHASLLDHIYGVSQKTELTNSKSFALTGTLAADGGHALVFSALINGGILHVISDETLHDNDLMFQYVDQNHIDYLKMFPSLWLSYSRDGQPLMPRKTILLGGEILPQQVINKLINAGYTGDLYNHYGPTEASTGKVIFKVNLSQDHTTIPLGKPFSTTQITIVDSEGRLLPQGIPGEIYISGIGVGRGYLNRPELTAERFLSQVNHGVEIRTYTTGDIGRWNADGNLEFLGRKDDQVKIRGFRIELGEIEHHLMESTWFRQVCVTAVKNATGKHRLVAYVVPNQKLERSKVIGLLEDKLPHYMVPSQIIEKVGLPLLPNGKINRKELAHNFSEEVNSSEPYVTPETKIEIILSDIWKELLRKEFVGVNENFFELGGDSIISIQMISRLRRLGYKCHPKDIFTSQTISKLADCVVPSSQNLGEQGRLSGPVGMLPSQLKFFEVSETSHFNQSVLVGIDKSIKPKALEHAVVELMNYHDALRCIYRRTDNRWLQYYGEGSNSFAIENFEGFAGDRLTAHLESRCNFYQRSLQIEEGSLVRVVLFEMPDHIGSNRLLIIIHHLATDGISWRILFEDIENLLSGNSKKRIEKGTSTRQWHQALEQYVVSRRLISQTEYWNKIASKYVPALSADSTVLRSKDIQSVFYQLAQEQTTKLLKEAHSAYNTTVDDLLLSALAKTMATHFKRQEIVIGREGHGRNETISPDIDLSRTIGWFTALYPVALVWDLNNETGSNIKGIKEDLRAVPDEGIGFGLLKFFNKENDLKLKSWDIVFNYLGQTDNVLFNSKYFTKVEQSSGKQIDDLFEGESPISVNVSVQNDQLGISWRYNAIQIEPATIELLASEYVSNLQSIINHCSQLAESEKIFTPSDFGLGNVVSARELEDFIKRKDNTDNDIMSF